MKTPQYIANREAAEAALRSVSGTPAISKRAASMIMDAIIAGQIPGVKGERVSRPADKRGLQYKIDVLTSKCEGYLSDANRLKNALREEQSRIYTLRRMLDAPLAPLDSQAACG